MSKSFSKLFKKKMSFGNNEKSAPTASNNPFSSSYGNTKPSTGDAAPPAYTPKAPQTNNNTSLQPSSAAASVYTSASRMSDIVHNDDDKFAFLAEMDTIFLIDDSGSMYGSRWNEASAVLGQITEICTTYDQDGIDLYFLNHSSRHSADGKAKGGYYNINSPATVDQIFKAVEPRGATFTGKRLHHILKPYLDRLMAAERTGDEVKPINIIVITDGAPTDDPEDNIVHYAHQLDKIGALRWQAGIQFFQVGDCRAATAALQALDDDLKKNHGCRDMVDTAKRERGTYRPWKSDEILKIVLGAVQSKVDKKEIINGKLV